MEDAILARVELPPVEGTTQPPLAALVRQAEEDFGIRLTSIVAAEGGEDTEAVVFKAMTADGGAVALKVTRHSTAGPLVAAHLAGLGVAGVPSPRVSRTGQPVSARDGWRLRPSRGSKGASRPMRA